jgi:hypothetical protein
MGGGYTHLLVRVYMVLHSRAGAMIKTAVFQRPRTRPGFSEGECWYG